MAHIKVVIATDIAHMRQTTREINNDLDHINNTMDSCKSRLDSIIITLEALLRIPPASSTSSSSTSTPTVSTASDKENDDVTCISTPIPPPLGMQQIKTKSKTLPRCEKISFQSKAKRRSKSRKQSKARERPKQDGAYEKVLHQIYHLC